MLMNLAVLAPLIRPLNCMLCIDLQQVTPALLVGHKPLGRLGRLASHSFEAWRRGRSMAPFNLLHVEDVQVQGEGSRDRYGLNPYLSFRV